MGVDFLARLPDNLPDNLPDTITGRCNLLILNKVESFLVLFDP